MRALVDVHKCSGQARCVAVAPDIFVLNDDGYNERVENAVPSGLDEQARRGVRACPERAITLVEDASGPLADAVDGEGR